MPVPTPTPIYRLVHVDCLGTLLARNALHSPNHTPNDGRTYRTIHDPSVQAGRQVQRISVGPGAVIHDYVAFYFGALSVMLLKLRTGKVAGYTEGQEPLIYLKSTVQEIVAANCGYVFADGHGLAAMTRWFDDLARLDQLDWPVVHARYWADTPDDNDRQRRKQAEFLIHQECAWPLIQEIGVFNSARKAEVEAILTSHAARSRPPVSIQTAWYY